MHTIVLFLADLCGVPLMEKVPVLYKKGYCCDCAADRMITSDNLCSVCKSCAVDLQAYRTPPCVSTTRAERVESAKDRKEVV